MFLYLLMIVVAVWLFMEGAVGLLLGLCALWFCIFYFRQGYDRKVSDTDLDKKVLQLLKVFYKEYDLGHGIGLDANGSQFIEDFCVPLKSWAEERELGTSEMILVIDTAERLFPLVCYKTKLDREVCWTDRSRKPVRKILELVFIGKPVPTRLRETLI